MAWHAAHTPDKCAMPMNACVCVCVCLYVGIIISTRGMLCCSDASDGSLRHPQRSRNWPNDAATRRQPFAATRRPPTTAFSRLGRRASRGHMRVWRASGHSVLKCLSARKALARCYLCQGVYSVCGGGVGVARRSQAVGSLDAEPCRDSQRVWCGVTCRPPPEATVCTQRSSYTSRTSTCSTCHTRRGDTRART